MYKKNFKDKRNNFNRRKGGDIEIKKWEGSTPTKEHTSEASLTYNTKAFRDLQNVGAIELRADPNAEITKGGYPYQIIARTNKVVDAVYAGVDNIDGNVLTRLQNSNKSQLLNLFDVATINFRSNYLYMCYSQSDVTHHNNLAVNVEMLKSFNEALSKAYSTMTTQLPYYTDDIRTDIPVPSVLTDDQKKIYGKMGGLLHYQTVLQNAMSPISKYIETRSLEQTVLDMSYRREAPTITALFGLLKKAAFITTLNAVGTNVISEYFDLNWYKQVNTLVNVPSRKANAMLEPLLTATATTAIPSCTMATTSGVTYYNSADVLKATGIFLNPDTWQLEGTTDKPVTLTFEQLVYRLDRLLDVSSIITWARKLNTDPSSVYTINSPSAYYQQIVKLIERVNLILTAFTTSMTDVRTFIDKLDVSNMVYWKKGVALTVDHIAVNQPTYNVILHNMIAAYIGGSATMIFDNNTQRWQASTLWNKYEGIAEFDKRSGGSFLTFGLRNLEVGNLEPTDTAMCLPVMFAADLTPGSSKCVATTRTGYVAQVTGEIQSSITNNAVLARLDPLAIGFSVKIPTMNVSSAAKSPSELAKIASAALEFLATIAGYGTVYTSDSTSHTICDPDFICYLDIQISDVSNEMIQFCRNYSPFRVMTPDGSRTIGFGTK